MTLPDDVDAVLDLTPQIGPVAVVVLLELTRQSETATVASIGRRLGLGRDRIAHALVHLREVGLVSVSQARAGGRFAATKYSVHLPTTAPPSHRRRAACNGTLPLFPEPA
jgi:hypothetical protein